MWLDLITRVIRGKANGVSLDQAIKMSELTNSEADAAAKQCLRSLTEAKERNARFKSAATKCMKRGKHT